MITVLVLFQRWASVKRQLRRPILVSSTKGRPAGLRPELLVPSKGMNDQVGPKAELERTFFGLAPVSKTVAHAHSLLSKIKALEEGEKVGTESSP
jgi:hypothetical protein